MMKMHLNGEEGGPVSARGCGGQRSPEVTLEEEEQANVNLNPI